MSEMVERVARAIWDGGHERAYPWATLSEGNKVYWADVARDAIAAMREPTDWMEMMGTQAWMCEHGMEDRSRACWQAMIDAALGGAGSEPSCESPHDTEDRPEGAPEGWRPAPDEEDELAEAAFHIWKATAAKYLRGGK